MFVIYFYILILSHYVTSEYEYVFSVTVNDTALKESYPTLATLNCQEYAIAHGFDMENHTVITEDGYILTIFHIPGNGEPLLLSHGVIDSADNWFQRGNKSIGFAFVDSGYDVWVGNVRGNRYGRQHESLDPDKDARFWNFSYHEYGYYDMAATVDYILDITGREKLKVVGHSLGTTVFYVLGATRPEYNEKIDLLVSLAPIAYLHNAAAPSIPIAVAVDLAIDWLLDLLGQQELVGDRSIIKVILEFVCHYDPKFCAEVIIYPFTGVDRYQVELDFYTRLMVRYPSGTSRKTAMHLSQTRSSKRFAHYDYGSLNNIEIYGQAEAPDYNLTAATMKVALIGAKNDGLSSLKDVDLLRKGLPNVVDYYVIKFAKWNHADYVWAREINIYLLPKVLDVLNNY